MVAVGVRVFALISYFPALLISNTHDSAGYIASARNAFFWTGEEPSGYPLFLRLVHAISHDLWFTVALQHALGILAGLLLLLAALRLGAPLLIALAPALVLWLNGDQLFLEQAPLSEAVFTFLLVLSVYAAVRTLEGSSRWGAILGASLTGLVVTRTVGVPLPVVVLGSLVIATWRLRLRWHPVASALASLVALLASYSFATHLETGRWSPLARHTSWHLYSRAAEFADCTKFTPPRGTRFLCETTPPDKRPGPGYYEYVGGPAIRAFGIDRGDHLVGQFALSAITHQTGSYLGLVLTDLVRYVAPGFGPRRVDDFLGPGAIEFPASPMTLDPAAVEQVRAYYGPGSVPSTSGSTLLRSYQKYVRLGGPTLLVAVILALVGAAAASGRTRWVLLLMIATGCELIFVPTLTYAGWRYAVPAEGPLVCAAAVAGWIVAGRASNWRRGRTRPPSDHVRLERTSIP